MQYLLVSGNGTPMFVHSKCEDELLAKAEILLFAELASLEYPGRPVVGSYEVQPNLTIAELKRAYRYDHKGYRRLLEWRDRILREGWFHPSWKPED